MGIQTPTQIPSPQEIGLPEKFQQWRTNQEAAIDLILNDTKRVTAICAPTGSGKSPAYVGAAVLSGKPTCIVTENRGLQDQLMTDFAEIGMVDIRGRSNYQCGMREDYTCEDGIAARCPYKGTVNCPSSQAEMRAATSSLVTTNYAKWIYSRRYGQGMSHFHQVVFDEGHAAPHQLAETLQVTLHHKEIEENLKMKFPSRPESEHFLYWKPWLANARAEADEAMIAAKARIDATREPKTAWVKHFNHMRALARRLATISTANVKNWVVDETKEGFKFDPINTACYAESSLLLHTPRVIVLSATLRKKTIAMIGVSPENFSFTEFDSDFDPKRCPIYWIPTMNVDHKAGDLGRLWVRLDQIAAKRADRKGIVHTVSYARRDEITQRSRFGQQMMVNPRGEPASWMVDEFKQAGPGTIFVSPSVGSGYDFPMSDCEWQFVCKVPFPDGRSKIMAARQQVDKEYGPYLAMQALVQAFGRGMRSKDDQCENFIADDHFGKWFYRQYAHLAPRSFHAFYQVADIVPPPPPRIGV